VPEISSDEDPSPQVSLVFSGGVFRGVFLVGVVNALNELSLRPNLVAGSSVGSITAAMVARVFSEPAPVRQLQIVGVAATFLALDHLIVTDRFADFVRRFTLRAAETNFSIGDVDGFFRRYDAQESGKFVKTARGVAAGIEHLLYVSPWELFDIIRAFRAGDLREADRLTRRHVQEFLDRSGVGLEVLGTEPLRLLISQHAITDEHRPYEDALPISVYESGRRKVRFLVTATNLQRGRRRVLGDESTKSAKLIQSLLASSAFPGIFRPRWEWEVLSSDATNDQLMDGGVMDNLPLEAIVTALEEQSDLGEIARRPWSGVPHLIFTASLEPEVPPLTTPQARNVAASWIETRSRARKLSYNKKIDQFARVQRHLRDIQQLYSDQAVELDWTPLDIEVLVVKPQWLCGTYAFHPMLGFKKQMQAASIAHGCASTFATISRFATDPARKAWLALWHVSPRAFEEIEHEAFREGAIVPRLKEGGRCYFRKDTPCPFSPDELSRSNIPPTTQRELSAIYEACGHSATHVRGGPQRN